METFLDQIDVDDTGETVEEISLQIKNCDVLNELDDSTDVTSLSISVDKDCVDQKVESVTELSGGGGSESVVSAGAEQITESVIEPISEAVSQSATEFVNEPATEPVTEPVIEPVTEPATESTTESTTEPVAEPTTNPITDPITNPTTDPITEFTTEPIAESTPRSLSHLKLSDLISETVSLTRSPSQIPDELNTRLFMLNQQINSDTPDTHLIRELLSYHSVPSIPSDYRHGVYCCLLGVC